MRYRVEIDREPRAAFAEWEDALRFAKAAAAADEDRTVQVIETGDEPELIMSMRHGQMAIVGNYSYTLPEEREQAKRRPQRREMVELNDEEHELILDNPEAAAFCAEQSIQWALSKGWSRELAEHMYRPRKPEPALGTEDLNRITKEITLGLEPAIPDTPLMAETRKKLEVEITEAKEKGLMIDLVSEI